MRVFKYIVCVLIFFFSLVFSIDYSQIYKLVDKKLSAYEEKLDSCQKKKQFYNRLVSKIDYLLSQDKFSKYKRLLKIIKIVAIKRANKIYCQVYIPSKYLGKGDWLLHNQFDYTGLKDDILNFSGIKVKKFFNPVVIRGVQKLEDFTEDFYLKIDGKRYLYQGDKVLKVDCGNPEAINQCLNYIKEKFGEDRFYGVYQNKGQAYIYVFNPYGFVSSPFNPRISFEQNFKNLSNQGLIYITGFLYKADSQNGYNIWGVALIKNKLFALTSKGQASFYVLSEGDKLRLPVKNSPLIVIRQSTGMYLVLTGGLNFYYLGDRKYFGDKIDLRKWSKILYNTFAFITESNYPYTKKDYINLLYFAKKFDGKKLSDLYKYITKKFIYNPVLKRWIEEEKLSQDQIDKKLKDRPTLLYNWIVFYTLREKQGVCESFSDLFSLIALLNGLEGDTIQGYTKDNTILHQVSQIEDRYYDPTYDLGKDSMLHFAMNRKKLLEYFIPQQNN